VVPRTLVVVCGLLAACSREKVLDTQGPVAPEVKAYVRNLELTGTEIKAHEAFSGSQLVEITGKVTNKGDKTVGQVDVICIFYDMTNREVSRQRVALVRGNAPPLKPGDSRPFRLPFDDLPKDWNQAPPQLVIAAIKFV